MYCGCSSCWLAYAKRFRGYKYFTPLWIRPSYEQELVASFLPTIANGTFFGANLHASMLVHDLNGCLDGGNIAQLRQQKRGQVGLMRHEGVWYVVSAVTLWKPVASYCIARRRPLARPARSQFVVEQTHLFQASTTIMRRRCGCNFVPVICNCSYLLIMAALCNRAGHYIFALWFLLSSSSFFFFLFYLA